MTTTPRTPRRAAAAAAKPAAARTSAPIPGATPSVLLTMELLGRGATPDLIASVLVAKEREDKAAGAIAYSQALSAFQAKGVQLIKTTHREFVAEDGSAVDYWYAPLPQVIDAVRPVLQECGLVHSFRTVDQTADWITVACRITHLATGHTEETQMGGPPDFSGEKQGAQAFTSTTTLLQRATLKAALGLAEQQDDGDGRRGTPSTKPAASAPAPAPAGPVYMDTAEFAKKLTSWRGHILTATRTVDEIVAITATRTPLSPAQIEELRAIERAAPVAA